MSDDFRGRGGSPWGSPPGGGNNNGSGRGPRPPNIDEIIKLIRSSKSPAEAREDLMDREWPAKDVKSLIKLIDDPRHGITAKGNCSFTEEQARAILELRLQRLTAMGIDEIKSELDLTLISRRTR